MNHFTNALRNFRDFKGRSSRAEYAWYGLLSLVVDLAYLLLASGKFDPFSEQFFENNPLISFGALLVLLVLAAIGLALTVRRLHDLNTSGWWLVPCAAIEFFIPRLSIALDLILLFKPAVEPNRFGQQCSAGLDTVAATVANSATYGVMMPAAPSGTIGEIERLVQMKATGSLSDSEFQMLKANVLGKAA